MDRYEWLLITLLHLSFDSHHYYYNPYLLLSRVIQGSYQNMFSQAVLFEAHTKKGSFLQSYILSALHPSPQKATGARLPSTTLQSSAFSIDSMGHAHLYIQVQQQANSDKAINLLSQKQSDRGRRLLTPANLQSVQNTASWYMCEVDIRSSN